MALSGLDIYKLLPKTNCRDCGFATCLAFAMALAQKKVSLDKCPHVSKEAEEALESAAQPPIKLVTIGTGESRIEVGNETVMYRHEQKFFHPPAIGILIEDTMDEASIGDIMSKAEKLSFERVGQVIAANLICVKNSSGYKNKFVNAVRKIMTLSAMNIALYAGDVDTMEEALALCKEKRPLVISMGNSLEKFIALAKNNNVPLAITVDSLEEAAQKTEKAKAGGVSEIVLNLKSPKLSRRIQNFTFIRRLALKKNFRALGYPIMAVTENRDPALELAEAISYVAKYACIVIVNTINRESIFALLTARQDIYTDPQKPVQVEPRIYEIGKVTNKSPVLVTTNFSITYFTVASEVESSKVPSYIVCCDSEGMSVLTAWAAEKFTAEKISDTLAKSGITGKVSHKKVVIPGYVSVLSGKLEEISGWKVAVGPREASGLPNYLRSLK